MDRYSKMEDGTYDVVRLSQNDIYMLDDIEKYDNALCQGDAVSINEFAYAAMHNEKIASIAGASSNSELIWWIGADTMTQYRRKGLASLLVNKIDI